MQKLSGIMCFWVLQQHNIPQVAYGSWAVLIIVLRNMKKFIIQGGDPTGTGKGGRSIYGKYFEDEIVDVLKVHPVTCDMPLVLRVAASLVLVCFVLRLSCVPSQHDRRGLLSMANRGPNTNGMPCSVRCASSLLSYLRLLALCRSHHRLLSGVLPCPG